ncbi:MAG: membrane protein insertase YidC [Paracoccaceae bacterium]|nr:membrane protein insertase YidC [Paracoccaceae bacterium]
MDDQNRNLLLATALSFLVILVWFIMFPPEEPVPPAEPAVATDGAPALPPAAAPGTAQPGIDAPAGETAGAAALPEEAPRAAIDTARLKGSISLQGGRIDDLSLRDYRETLDPGADIVHLLNPLGAPGAYYALYGWVPGGALDFDDVPGADTDWALVEGETLAPGQPLTLEWSNAGGLTFQRRIEVDEDFLFTITQSVTNETGGAVRMAPYGVVARHGLPEDLKGFFILHEGAIGMFDGELGDTTYDNMTDLGADPLWGPSAEVTQVAENGWIGITDHYWMTALIPEPGTPFTAVKRYFAGEDAYRTEIRLPTMEIAPGATQSATTRLFAGAKEWEAIRGYERAFGIDRFVDSIDWGWFYFLTKPIFQLLHWLNGIIGNMGWSIIGLTLVIKVVLFPLAYKSYASMAKMRELQPEMEKIKERAGDDRQKLQQEMMALYKSEKVNPASGCLPILLQIPIFFSLYKVIFVTIELRHAPWLGWIRDLSAPDPSSIFNFWGIAPWAGPEPGSIMALIFIGILPLCLGVSMWLQQKLNPAPTDPTQAAIFAWMPWVFMFMLGSFASGLVIYWIANNVITFIQQYLIMRSHGYKPDLFGNILSSFKKKAPAGGDPPAKK